MKKFTYLNNHTFIGTILEENEYGYTIEFKDESVVEGFTDTTFLEKEFTTVEEIVTTTKIETANKGNLEGVAVEGRKYTFLVENTEMAFVRVHRIEKRMVENKDSEDFGKVKTVTSYVWDVNKKTLKGSGGLNEKVMKVIKEMV